MPRPPGCRLPRLGPASRRPSWTSAWRTWPPMHWQPPPKSPHQSRPAISSASARCTTSAYTPPAASLMRTSHGTSLGSRRMARLNPPPLYPTTFLWASGACTATLASPGPASQTAPWSQTSSRARAGCSKPPRAPPKSSPSQLKCCAASGRSSTWETAQTCAYGRRSSRGSMASCAKPTSLRQQPASARRRPTQQSAPRASSAAPALKRATAACGWSSGTQKNHSAGPACCPAPPLARHPR